MSARNNRQSRQSHRFPRHAAVISAAARADVGSARRCSPGLAPCTGAVPDCRATPALGSGAEVPGDGAR